MLKMKLMFLLFGLLAINLLVDAKPTKTQEEDDDMQNDDYGDEYDDEDEEDESTSGPPPEIKSKGLHLTGNPDGSVVLPCDAINADNFVILWKKNQNLIFQDMIATGTQEPRYTIFKNRSIAITKLNSNDTAEYECSILAPQELKVVHKLEVSTPPKIVSISPSGKHEIMVGSVLELHCEASGVPKPKITWSKAGNRVMTKEGSYEGPTVTFESVQKDNAGTYQCLADNGILNPSVAAVDIVVLYPPTIKIEKLTVNSAEGYESQLTCIVHGMPKPSVTWRKDSHVLVSDNNVNIINEGNRHILKVLNTRKSDFGNYTCMAENKIGEQEKHVTLSGKPAPAEFVSAHLSPSGEEANVEFKVESNSPIIEYQLQYRLKGKNEEWKTENPKVTNPDGNIYTVSHVLRELEPEKYEVKIRSKNNYGWSHYSHHKTIDAQQRIEEEEPMPVSENREEPQKSQSSSAGQTVSSVLFVVAVSLYSTYV